MHRSYEGETDPMKALAITTGPCELVRWDVDTAAEVRRKDKPWWKGDFLLDGIRWIDYGSDPNPMYPPSNRARSTPTTRPRPIPFRRPRRSA